VVRDGETGRLVPDGDVEALAAAIVDLLDNEPVRTAMTARARAFARDHFTGWDERVSMEIDVLEKLTASGSPARAGS
jgi:glycosyltransferase involved in cell wall biosynthesis